MIHSSLKKMHSMQRRLTPLQCDTLALKKTRSPNQDSLPLQKAFPSFFIHTLFFSDFLLSKLSLSPCLSRRVRMIAGGRFSNIPFIFIHLLSLLVATHSHCCQHSPIQPLTPSSFQESEAECWKDEEEDGQANGDGSLASTFASSSVFPGYDADAVDDEEDPDAVST